MSTDSISRDGNILVAAPNGRLAQEEAVNLRNSLRSHLEVEGSCLLLDLTAVDYMTSAALGVVISLLQKVKSSGGRMAVAAPDERVHTLLEVAGLNQLLELCHSRSDAEKCLKGEDA